MTSIWKCRIKSVIAASLYILYIHHMQPRHSLSSQWSGYYNKTRLKLRSFLKRHGFKLNSSIYLAECMWVSEHSKALIYFKTAPE